uniref:F-box protein n=1 Tax=Kalanchoe fedtschenkoi TaxID=63787 RepID=A0A7N0UF82_KALFE
MASLRASSLLMQTSTSTSSSRCSSCKSTRISAAIHVPKMPHSLRVVAAPMSSPGASSKSSFVEDHKTAILESIKQQSRPLSPSSLSPSSSTPAKNNNNEDLLIMSEVYMILEAVSDRAEMHRNVGEQRNNWNTLLLNSINMMTLTATAMTGLAECEPAAHVGLNASSFLLFTAAAGMLAIMNKIQPSQLAEEQRNATRLFKRLEQEIRTLIALKRATKADVESLMGRVLALDRAYPLPLLGAMIEKFPSQFKPARWWPEHENENPSIKTRSNGWSGALESRMRDVVRVIKAKDSEEYQRLGSRALELNKALAVTGPALTGIAALASAFATNHSALGSDAAMVAGALACAVNSLEHGGQVGMVAEMYRNCAGQLEQMEESIESAAADRREHGEVFEMKVALQLGRSLSELRHLARKSSSCGGDGSAVDEFASKLF